MFGGYGLYFNAKFFAIIGEDTLFIKVTNTGSLVAGNISKEAPYPGASLYFKISPAKLRQRTWLTALVEETAKSLDVPKKKKSK